MASGILLVGGSVVLLLWGVAHILPTKSVVNGFGSLSGDNRRILIMEWVAEGMTLCFLALLVMMTVRVGDLSHPVSLVVIRGAALMLILMAIWSLFTGARTAALPMKLCPFVKMAVAACFLLGSF